MFSTEAEAISHPTNGIYLKGFLSSILPLGIKGLCFIITKTSTDGMEEERKKLCKLLKYNFPPCNACF